MKEARLGNVCEINPPTDKSLRNEADCSFVPMEYVDEYLGAIAKTDIRRVGDVKQGYTFFRDGDVIFAKITPCMENGKCAVARNLTNGIGFGSTEFHVLRAGANTTPEWIYYFLRQEQIRQSAVRWFRGTAGQQRVPADFLDEVEISLPPLPEQRRLSALLDRADRLRRLRRYALELSETYLQSVFLEMFGDPERNPKKWEPGIVDEAVASSQYGTSQKSNSEGRGYPILGMVNITYSGGVDLSSLACVELTKNEFEELRLERGDIIFNRTNSTELVGKTAQWTHDFDAVLASYLVKLKLKNNILPDYFVALLNTAYYKQLFQQRCKKAVGQSNISPTLLKEFPCWFPPRRLQESFATMARRVEKLRSQQREALRQAEMLFGALLKRAFEGEA